MKILKLSLKNFKGIKNFILDTNGGNVDVYGENATGKTTLFDAFIWLLFDKDSANKKDFQIKTLDSAGKAINGLEHEVEGIFEIDGKQLSLRKVYSEKWTKKRGSATATFTGHTVDHFINGVPVKKSEYTAKIDQIAREDIFKLLTNPIFFNEQLHWQERRKILLSVCSDISDEDVIASDKSLSKLPEILQGRMLEDHRKIITARRAEINKELDRIPVRIDEVEQSLPDITGLIPEEITQRINTLKRLINEKNQQIARIEGGGEIAEKMKALREVEARLIEIKNEYYSRHEAHVRQKQDKLDAVKDKVRELQNEVRAVERLYEFNESSIKNLQSQMDKLRADWKHINEQQFEYEQDDICPTCGQFLPTEKITEARNKALSQFNLNKSGRLEAISFNGKQLKAKVDELTEVNVELSKKLENTRTQLAGVELEANTLQKEVGEMRMKMVSYNKDPAYIEKLQEKESLEQAIKDLKEGRNDELLSIRTEIDNLESEIKTAESLLSNIDRVKQGIERIEELKEQERKLASEYERMEEELYLTEQFIRTKVSMLEERINSRFKYARFKLFDVQVNGGVAECCETLYGGVPYSGGLNNAARINIGLDIINTLSEHYGFIAPIFIDNAEAVTQLIKTRGQVIRLVVDESAKELTVNHKTMIKEAV